MLASNELFRLALMIKSFLSRTLRYIRKNVGDSEWNSMRKVYAMEEYTVQFLTAIVYVRCMKKDDFECHLRIKWVFTIFSKYVFHRIHEQKNFFLCVKQPSPPPFCVCICVCAYFHSIHICIQHYPTNTYQCMMGKWNWSFDVNISGCFFPQSILMYVMLDSGTLYNNNSSNVYHSYVQRDHATNECSTLYIISQHLDKSTHCICGICLLPLVRFCCFVLLPFSNVSITITGTISPKGTVEQTKEKKELYNVANNKFWDAFYKLSSTYDGYFGFIQFSGTCFSFTFYFCFL